MQVHDTPLVINAKGATVAVTVGAGGADVYYGASAATASRVNGGTLAAAGSTFQVTAPTWVVRSDQSQAPAADLSFVEQAPSTSAGSAGSSGPVLVNVKTAYGAKGDNTTDDTAAIQAAIDAVVTAGGGTVFFPKGIYLVSGALKTTATSGGGGRAYRSQITLPDVNQATAQKVVLRLQGEQPAGTFAGLTTSSAPAFSGGSIIRSTLTGQTYSGTTGWPSMIGGPDDVPNGQFEFSNLMVDVLDLGFRAPSNPTVTLLNLERIASANVRRCLFDTDDAISSVVRPTNPTGRGLILPGQNNNTMVHAEDVAVQGLFTGVRFSEHTHLDTVQVFECTIAIDPNSRTHAAKLSNIGIEWCPFGFGHVADPTTAVTGSAFTTADYPMIGNLAGNTYFSIDLVSLEESSAGNGAPWTRTLFLVNDPGNHIRTTMPYQRVVAGSGAAGTGAAFNGCGNMRTKFFANAGGEEINGVFNGSQDALRVTGGTGTVSLTRGASGGLPGVKTKAGGSGKAIAMLSGTSSGIVAFDNAAPLNFWTDTGTRIDTNLFDGTGTGKNVAQITALGGIRPGNGAATPALGGTVTSGSGAPTTAGALGDYYLRTDTPGTAGQRIYVCTTAGAAGTAVWTATAA